MTDQEFDILDELYFIKSYDELARTFRNGQLDLDKELWNLLLKKWVKAMDSRDNEVTMTEAQFLETKKHYRFNATKSGLLAHNQI